MVIVLRLCFVVAVVGGDGVCVLLLSVVVVMVIYPWTVLNQHSWRGVTKVTNCLVHMPDPIRIRSGSARKLWTERGPMILAHRLASGPDPFGQNLTQSARTKSDPGWFCAI